MKLVYIASDILKESRGIVGINVRSNWWRKVFDSVWIKGTTNIWSNVARNIFITNNFSCTSKQLTDAFSMANSI